MLENAGALGDPAAPGQEALVPRGEAGSSASQLSLRLGRGRGRLRSGPVVGAVQAACDGSRGMSIHAGHDHASAQRALEESGRVVKAAITALGWAKRAG